MAVRLSGGFSGARFARLTTAVQGNSKRGLTALSDLLKAMRVADDLVYGWRFDCCTVLSHPNSPAPNLGQQPFGVRYVRAWSGAVIRLKR